MGLWGRDRRGRRGAGEPGDAAGALLVVLNSEGDGDSDDDDDDDDDTDPEADPLFPAGGLGLLDRAVELAVALVHVGVDRGHLVVDLGDRLVLLLDEHRKLVEHLRELGHRPLDLLDLGVALLHLAVRRARGTVAVRVQQGLREHLRVVALSDLLDLLGGRIGLDNLELACCPLLGLYSVLLLDLLVLLQQVLEPRLGGRSLRLLVLALRDLVQLLDGSLARVTRLAGLLSELVGIRDRV